MNKFTLIYSGKIKTEHIFFAISDSDMYRIDIDVSDSVYSIGIKKMESISFLETARVITDRLSLMECINIALAVVRDIEKKNVSQSTEQGKA